MNMARIGGVKLAAAALVCGCALASSAYDVRFKNIYQSRMVLQAGKANEVAGRSDPDASIAVTGEAVPGTDDDYDWVPIRTVRGIEGYVASRFLTTDGAVQ